MGIHAWCKNPKCLDKPKNYTAIRKKTGGNFGLAVFALATDRIELLHRRTSSGLRERVPSVNYARMALAGFGARFNGAGTVGEHHGLTRRLRSDCISPSSAIPARTAAKIAAAWAPGGTASR